MYPIHKSGTLKNLKFVFLILITSGDSHLKKVSISDKYSMSIIKGCLEKRRLKDLKLRFLDTDQYSRWEQDQKNSLSCNHKLPKRFDVVF